MPRISSIELLKTPPQPVLSIRTRSPVDKLPMIISQGYGKIAAYLTQLGEYPSSMPFVAYHNMDMADLSIELGFPIAAPLPDSDDIRFTLFPGGLRVFCMYQGAYSDLEPVYVELTEWIAAKGFTPVGPSYEYYYNGPDCPESQLLTQIVMPVR